jgi:hypothetical protein
MYTYNTEYLVKNTHLVIGLIMYQYILVIFRYLGNLQISVVLIIPTTRPYRLFLR